ncbi:hypothetical protein [Streptacidiphilus pinicola]|nr:hypothetical protein [Streptacidiphilus pinicola]
MALATGVLFISGTGAPSGTVVADIPSMVLTLYRQAAATGISGDSPG